LQRVLQRYSAISRELGVAIYPNIRHIKARKNVPAEGNKNAYLNKRNYVIGVNWLRYGDTVP
jgi:hypothetical protein